ncbi:MAG: potassium channel family protein [Cyanophyceae cyanobacterium]
MIPNQKSNYSPNSPDTHNVQVIVCGLGRTGYRIFSLLRQQGIAVSGISERPFPRDSSTIVVGDPCTATTLMRAGIRQASTLVIASSKESDNLAILMQARLLNPKIFVINRLFNSKLGDRLDQTLPYHASLSVSKLAAPVFTFSALGSKAIGQLELSGRTWPIHEEFIHRRHPWRGRALYDLWVDRDTMLIYYLPNQTYVNESAYSESYPSVPQLATPAESTESYGELDGSGDHAADPPGDDSAGNFVGESHRLVLPRKMDLVGAVLARQSLEPGDRIIVATHPKTNRVRYGLQRQWTKFLAGVRSFQSAGEPAVAAITALTVAIVVSISVYVGTTDSSPVDALYFAVGMITGAGGEEKVAEQSPELVKIFTAVMMLIGAAIIGICYALLNDYILGSRFRRLLTVAQMPTRDHFIVCGLGSLGVRIAQELHRSGYEVLVLDRNPNNRFLNIIRALKIPVVTEDASLPATLEAANIAHAAGLLAVTSDDTTNLEIVLSARTLAPKLSTTMRSEDPHFALMSQQVFDLDSVLSPVELAAPAFAATALGGKILGNGLTSDTLWVALGTLITPRHILHGKIVSEAAQSSDFVPLYLVRGNQEIRRILLLNARLRDGDVLHLSIPASKLAQLWQVTPHPFKH